MLFLISILTLSSAVFAKHDIVYNGSDIYLVPNGVKHTETLIYLHGVGGSAQIMLDQFFSNEETMFARDTTRVVLLTAPTDYVTIWKKESTSWFDIITFNVAKELDLQTAFNLSDIVRNSKRIKQVMNEEIERLGGDSTKLFIGGFSQGCFMSLYSGLTFDKTIGGIMGGSGYLVTIPMGQPISGPNTNIPLFLSHGMKDDTIWFDVAETIYRDRLSPLQHKITKVYEENVGHQITATMRAKERQWFFDQTSPKKEEEKLFLPIFN